MRTAISSILSAVVLVVALIRRAIRRLAAPGRGPFATAA